MVRCGLRCLFKLQVVVTLEFLSQTDYNKWDKIVASLSDDECDADAAPASSVVAAPQVAVTEPVGVGAGLSGAPSLL